MILKGLKYILLVLIVVFLWTIALPLDWSFSPWNVFGIYSSVKGWNTLSPLLSVGGALLVIIIAGGFFIERFFCRYLCPLGAIFAVISKLRLHVIRKPMDGCGSCRMCTRGCSMGIPLYKMDTVRSGECINCYRCVDVCPRGNAKATPWSAVVGIVAAVVIVCLYLGGSQVWSLVGHDYENQLSGTAPSMGDSLTPGDQSSGDQSSGGQCSGGSRGNGRHKHEEVLLPF